MKRICAILRKYKRRVKREENNICNYVYRIDNRCSTVTSLLHRRTGGKRLDTAPSARLVLLIEMLAPARRAWRGEKQQDKSTGSEESEATQDELEPYTLLER